MTHTKEQLKEWGYKEYDAKFDDPEWLTQQLRKEREDPRENPNFFLDVQDPEFWNNAARKPYAKALLASESHWNSRRETWLQQYENVKELNKVREEVAQKLEDCEASTKRMVVPMLGHKIVQVFLMHVNQKAIELDVPFTQQIETAEVQQSLHHFRNTSDNQGDNAMEDLFSAWDSRSMQQLKDDHAKAEKAKLEDGVVVGMQELTDALNLGVKYKKDGVVEWERGNIQEAIAAWRQAHKALSGIKAPDSHPSENKKRDDLHCAVLKNLAQAAIKLGYWNEALDAADIAVKIDDQDHKAWFRKACALEGMGRLADIKDCLDNIEMIAVGRPDRERIQKETQAKRDKVQTLTERDDAKNKRMLERGIQKSLFSDERDKPSLAAQPQPQGPEAISHNVELVELDEKTRKRLTRDGAEDLLVDLQNVYEDPTFRKQVNKLGKDVNDMAEFICYLKRVALGAQKPILEKWGFDPTDVGLTEMNKAIQDHTRGKDADANMKVQADRTLQALYGDFYDAVRGVVTERAPARKKKADGSDSEGEYEDFVPAYAHWTGLPVPRSASGGAAATQAKAPAKVSAKERKEIWAELGKAMSGTDAKVLRACLDRAIAAGFSAVTVRSAKRKLMCIGGDLDGLP